MLKLELIANKRFASVRQSFGLLAIALSVRQAETIKADVNRLTVASNPGVVLPRGGKAHAAGKKLRVDCLKEAIAEFPNLIRSVEGQVRQGVLLDRFERRCLDVDGWERTGSKL